MDARALVGGTVAAVVFALGAAPAAAADNPWLERRVLNIAHQGGEAEFPSNTLYAFKRAVRAGADMLELDVGVTKDGHVVAMHDTSVDRITNGTGLLSQMTLRQLERLDGAHWFTGGAKPYARGRASKAYRFRGIATGKRRPPKGFTAADFRVATLRDVLRAFPRTPMTLEIKGRTKAEEVAEYVRNAELLASALKGTQRRDLIVVSFKQQAVDRFHELMPAIGVAPGIDGGANYLLAGGSPGPGVVAIQAPITFKLGQDVLQVSTPEHVEKAHRDGYAWHVWLSDDGESPATWRRLIDMCVDGVMTSRPVAFEKVLRAHRPPPACG